MSIAAYSAIEHQSARFNPPIKITPPDNKQSFIETIKSDNTKQTVNYVFNGSSAALSLLTFLNGNFHFINSIQEKLEKFSEILAKIAFGTVSLMGAIDTGQKKNPFAFLGYLLSVPLATISSGYNLWLTSGIANGLCNFIVITDQREVLDKNGEPILDKKGNIQYINGDFKTRGWKKAITTTFSECLKMIKEVIHKPQKIKKISNAIFFSSLFEIAGPIIGLLGLEKIGSFIRNTATVAVESAMLLHKDKSPDKNQEVINLKSPVAQSGLLWVGTSLVDFLKRFDFISDKLSSLTHLSLGFDRAASILFTKGLLNVKKEDG